ncbi:MAG: YjiH family protein [Eubacterium sp.]|nr:YjiH family protein [Candidatus Colimonas fimequi]
MTEQKINPQVDEINVSQQEEPDYTDYAVLDQITLNESQKKKGMIRCIGFSILAVILFFCPLKINGSSTIMFAFIYKTLSHAVGNYGIYYVFLLSLGYSIMSVIHLFKGKSLPETHIVNRFCKDEGPIRTCINICGTVIIAIYTAQLMGIWDNPGQWLMHPEIGPVVIGSIVADCVWILPLGALLMPLLIEFGLLDFLGTFLERVMRPLFRTPGRSALDAVGSFVSAASVGVLITNSLYSRGVYTKREAVTIATGFSAVSIGFAFVVVDTAGLADQFFKVYFTSIIICFIVTAICCRIPPVCKKPTEYINGRVQLKEDFIAEREKVSSKGMFSLACERAVKKGYVAKPLGTLVKESVLTAMPVWPKVYTLMSAVCVLAMDLALFTPFFDWIGAVVAPVLNILQIPDAQLIAGAFWSGIAEMFIPVLMISGHVDAMSEMARFMVASVSMVQIIFFSDSATVMLATNIPVKVRDLVIIFIERTIIAIFICALAAHILYGF